MACSLAIGPTSARRVWDPTADSPRIPQTKGKYFGDTLCARATLVSVAVAVLLFFGGLAVFRSFEPRFADTI